MHSNGLVIVAATLGCLIAAGCAGRPAARAEAIGHSSDFDLDTEDAGAERPDAGTAAGTEDVYFDAGLPRLGQLISEGARQQSLSAASAGPIGASGLVLHVLERGPNQPWIISVQNDGVEPARFAADTRLLWFEVTPPGAKKAALCRLPDELQPKDVEPRLDIELQPGEYVTQLIDPRLYCFASGDQKQLVPGARVLPRLGWPELPDKTTWKAGKKSSEPVAQKPPFVAHLSSVDVDDALKARAAALKVANAARYKKGVTRPSDAALGVPLPAGIDKQLTGPDLTLQASYAEWSSRIPAARSPDDDGPLQIRLVQGSDARTEHNATVRMTLHNRSNRKVLLYFRREFVSFEVIGPDGITICNPAPDTRSPDRSAFISLKPGATKTYSSRLAELCPRDTFLMPGLYLVNARFDATQSGHEWNLDAYTGAVETDRPANVRIRTGELSILHKVALARPQPAPHASSTPASGSLDAGVH